MADVAMLEIDTLGLVCKYDLLFRIVRLDIMRMGDEDRLDTEAQETKSLGIFLFAKNKYQK